MYRIETNKMIAKRMKSQSISPSVGCVHWAGKLIRTLKSQRRTVDCLPVLVSGKDGIKLLGIPYLPKHKTGAG